MPLIVSQGGMGLPEKDYYLGADADSVRIRDAYKDFVKKLFTLAGDAPKVAAANADTVIRLETKLAEASRVPADLRDAEANYNKKTLAEFESLTPKLRWNGYFQNLVDPSQPAPNLPYLIVGQPEFFTHLGELLQSTFPSPIGAPICASNSSSTRPPISPPLFEQADFDFYKTTLSGVKQMEPRWKRVLGRINGNLDDQIAASGRNSRPALR